MARFCPSACGRLATAAVFISVGIVQVIAGIILLKSDYAYMLSGPNFWTALSNITVGVLLGVASTVWKTINKDSNKHSNRRKFLAALVGSIFILNATTAAMLIVGKGNNLLAIDLETGGVYTTKTLSKEILAYAYATSVCSPIVCVVVSIAFLTGICFRRKQKHIKTLDVKNILNQDDSQMYDWVYTSNLPKPDPGILKVALSSESDSSSSERDSDSSSDLPVPLHLRSRSSISEVQNSYHGSLANSSLPFSATRNKTSDDSVSSNFGKIRSIPRLNKSSLIKTPVRSYDKSVNESVNSCRTILPGRRLIPAMVAYTSDDKPGTPKRVEELSILEKSSNSPNFEYSAVFSPSPKTKLSFSLINQSSDSISKSANAGPSTSLQSSMEDSTDCEDSVLGSRDLQTKNDIYSPNSHSKICRTSTTDQTKIPQELKNLDDSAIQCETGENAFKEIYLGETSPEEKDKEKLSVTCPVTFRENEESFRTRGNMSMFVRDSHFRKKISTKLVQAAGPTISDGCSFYKASNRKSRKGRMKPYSKNSYDKYLQTGFSSFKDGGQTDEVDTMAHPKKLNTSLNTSLMTSISEKPSEEESDSFLPSTSTHTSGYMSASYEESDDEGMNSKPHSSRQQPSPVQKLMAAEIRDRYRKKTGRVSFESNIGSFQKDCQSNTKQQKIESRAAVSKVEIQELELALV